ARSWSVDKASLCRVMRTALVLAFGRAGSVGERDYAAGNMFPLPPGEGRVRACWESRCDVRDTSYFPASSNTYAPALTSFTGNAMQSLPGSSWPRGCDTSHPT